MSYPPYRNARRDFDHDPQVEAWENEGGRPAPEPSELSPLEWAMIKEFWVLQAEVDQEPAEYRREVA